MSSKNVKLLDKWCALQRSLLDPQLNSMDAAVFARLLFHHNSKNGRCFPSQSVLASALNRNPRTIRNSLRKLQTAGYVRVLGQRSGGSSNSYLLNIKGAEGSFQGAGKYFPERRKNASYDTEEEKRKEKEADGRECDPAEPKPVPKVHQQDERARTEKSFEKELAPLLGGPLAMFEQLTALPANQLERLSNSYLAHELDAEDIARQLASSEARG